MARLAMTVLAVILVAGFASTASQGAQQASPRIGYVHSEQILVRTPGYAAAESAFTAEFDAFRQEIATLRARLDSAVQEYDRQSAVLSAADQQAKIEQIRLLQGRVQETTQTANERAQARREELIAPLQERIQAVIDGVRAERNLAVIFDVAVPGTGIISADRTLDLTATIIRRLQESEPDEGS